jgi:uncharacterized lipoprotein YmbA
MPRSTTSIVIAICLEGCGAHDSDYYPYMLTGMASYVHDSASGKDLYAGHVETNYLGRVEATARCRDMATSLARANRLERWGYVCCTVTSDSGCATKVR